MRLRIVFTLAAMVTIYTLKAQDNEPIFLTNPSFEDMPRHSKPPRGWYDCGFENESPPDVQPSGTFSVTKPAQEGSTYLGMVVRDNDTWEAVSQRLSRPLQKGQCYEFSIYMARSELYVSTSRITNETANYTTPAKLRIYGGFGYCDKQYLLAESSLVINTRWLEYRFKLEPIDDYTYLIFEAFYKTPTLFPYNGNILIDDASALTPINCDEELLAETPRPEPEPEVAQTEEPAAPPAPAQPEPEVAATPPATPTPPAARPQAPEAEESISFSQVKRADLKEGTTIRIDKLFFEADKSVITPSSFEVLDEVYAFLEENDDVIVEIGGHTNGLPPDWYCDKLSTDRAKAVANYLSRKGIDRNRLQYKGYGKRKPVASDETEEGKRKNQRVEIKVIGFNG